MQGGLVAAYGIHRAFDLGFDSAADGEILLAADLPGPVVNAIDNKEHGITETAQQGKPAEIGSDGIEAVAVDAYIIALRSLVDVFVAKVNFVELQGQNLPEEVIVVAPQVDDFSAVLLGFFEDEPEKASVFDIPPAPFFKVPAIDDIAIHDELVTMDMAEEVIDLTNFAIGESKVDVRDDDRAIAELLAFHAEEGMGGRGSREEIAGAACSPAARIRQCS